MERILTRWLDIPDLRKLDVYVGNGGYKALRKALFEMKPEEIINEVKNSNLRGRGGAAFPTGVKWSFIPKDAKKPVYLCCNADESEPGTFANRYELEFDPHCIIEGIAIACRAVGAHTAYTYLRGEFTVQKRIFDADCGGVRQQLSRQEYSGLGLRPRRLHASRRRRIHMRRGDRAARIARRQARVSAQPSAVSGNPGSVPEPDGGEQRRDAVERPAYHQSRRRLVQIDRPREESRAETLLSLRAHQQAGPVRITDGVSAERSDLRRGRRNPRRQGSEGSHPGRVVVSGLYCGRGRQGQYGLRFRAGGGLADGHGGRDGDERGYVH